MGKHGNKSNNRSKVISNEADAMERPRVPVCARHVAIHHRDTGVSVVFGSV